MLTWFCNLSGFPEWMPWILHCQEIWQAPCHADRQAVLILHIRRTNRHTGTTVRERLCLVQQPVGEPGSLSFVDILETMLCINDQCTCTSGLRVFARSGLTFVSILYQLREWTSCPFVSQATACINLLRDGIEQDSN